MLRKQVRPCLPRLRHASIRDDTNGDGDPRRVRITLSPFEDSRMKNPLKSIGLVAGAIMALVYWGAVALMRFV